MGESNLQTALALGADIATDPYTQTYAETSRTVAAPTAVAPPPGGTGATAGAYDTAAHRDQMIAAVVATQADLLALTQVVNSLIDDLQQHGLVG